MNELEEKKVKDDLKSYETAISWHDKRVEVKTTDKEYYVNAPDLSKRGSVAEKEFVSFNVWSSFKTFSAQVGIYKTEEKRDTTHEEEARLALATLRNVIEAADAKEQEKRLASELFSQINKTLENINKRMKESKVLAVKDKDNFHTQLAALYSKVFKELSRFLP